MKTFLLNSVGYILSWTAGILFLVLNFIWAYQIGSMIITDDKVTAFLVGCAPLALFYLIVGGSIAQAHEDAFPSQETKQKFKVKIINKDDDDQEFTCDTVETVNQGDHYKVIMDTNSIIITRPGSIIEIIENS